MAKKKENDVLPEEVISVEKTDDEVVKEEINNPEAVENEESAQSEETADVIEETESIGNKEEASEDINEKPKQLKLGVLKIRLDDNLPEDDEFETLWNELVSVYRARKTVPVTVTGIERLQKEGYVVVTYYKTQRIVIPITEMMINLEEERDDGYTENERLLRACNSMLGSEIDVIIRGMDKENESVIASRKDAMNRKRERFYMTLLSDGLPQVRVNRVVEARIVTTTQALARVEIFGVETILTASQLSWDWIANVSETYHVGDTIDVLITEVTGDSIDNLRVKADVRSITRNISKENLSKCTVQSKYIGEITNVRNGIAYLRLKIGVNAIAHTNYDRRTPARGDIVSFVITRINPEFSNVTGIITKIIKQSI